MNSENREQTVITEASGKQQSGQQRLQLVIGQVGYVFSTAAPLRGRILLTLM